MKVVIKRGRYSIRTDKHSAVKQQASAANSCFLRSPQEEAPYAEGNAPKVATFLQAKGAGPSDTLQGNGKPNARQTAHGRKGCGNKALVRAMAQDSPANGSKPFQ